MTDSKAVVVACVATVADCGQNREDLIDKFKNEIKGEVYDGIFLDISYCPLSNRSIYTFAGTPNLVTKAAYSLADVVKSNVDFSNYNGAFPCFGALDDCAFIPVRGISLEQCHDLAEDLAYKLGFESFATDVVYRYDEIDDASLRDLLRFKAGSDKVPFLPSLGYSLIGATNGYINFNIHLFSTTEQATRIAYDIRDIGRGPDKPGTLKGCQAIGVWDNASKVASVTGTLHDHVSSTSLHSAYEEVLKIATQLNLPLMGSQVVGMIPLKVLLDAADFYIQRDGLLILEEDVKVKLAISKLGLNAKEPFDPRKKVFEYVFPSDSDLLVNKSLKEFIGTVGARVPVPAGGSVAATVAALGAALGCMVGQMTYGRKKWEQFDSQMRRSIPIMHRVMEKVISYVDEDTDAFKEVIAARKLPNETNEEKLERETTLQSAIIKTIEVPLGLARSVSETWSAAEELAPIITEGAISDLRVGAWCLQLAVKAAHSSILENVKGLKDDAYRNEVLKQMERHLQLAKDGKKNVLALLAKRHC